MVEEPPAKTPFIWCTPEIKSYMFRMERSMLQNPAVCHS